MDSPAYLVIIIVSVVTAVITLVCLIAAVIQLLMVHPNRLSGGVLLTVLAKHPGDEESPELARARRRARRGLLCALIAVIGLVLGGALLPALLDAFEPAALGTVPPGALAPGTTA